MAMPRKLKFLNTFLDGVSYLGVIESVTLPKLTRKLENYRGGGMSGSAPVDFGLELFRETCQLLQRLIKLSLLLKSADSHMRTIRHLAEQEWLQDTLIKSVVQVNDAVVSPLHV